MGSFLAPKSGDFGTKILDFGNLGGQNLARFCPKSGPASLKMLAQRPADAGTSVRLGASRAWWGPKIRGADFWG